MSVLDQKSLDHIHVDPTDRQRINDSPVRLDNGQFLRRTRHSSPHSNDHGGKIKMKPQLYDGTGDLDEYLAQFDILTEINDWNFSKKALHLAASLSGAALSVLSELSSSERTDFNLLVRTLKDRFGSEYRAEVFRSRFQTKVKGRNESIAELAQSVRKLTRKAYPSASQQLLDTLSLDHFIDAISDADIRLRLMESRPSDLNAAESLAIRLESYREAERQRSRTVRATTSTCSSDALPAERDINSLKQDLNSLATSVEKLKESVQGLNGSRHTSSFARQNFGSRRNNRGRYRKRYGDDKQSQNDSKFNSEATQGKRISGGFKGQNSTSSQQPQSVTINSLPHEEGLFLDLKIKNEQVKILVDTGANHSILSKHLVEKLKLSGGSIQSLRNTYLITATGESSPCLGRLDLPVSIGNQNLNRHFW